MPLISQVPASATGISTCSRERDEEVASIPSIHQHRAVKPKREHSESRWRGLGLGLSGLGDMPIWQLGQYRHIQNLLAAMSQACHLQVLVLVHPACKHC